MSTARHRQGLGGMLEAMNTGVRSSCLAGTLVPLGRQAVWRLGVVKSVGGAVQAVSLSIRPGVLRN